MSASSLHVLVIAQAWPRPNSPMLQRLQGFLARGWQVTFASPAAPEQQDANLSALRAVELVDSDFDPFIGGLAPDVVLFERFELEERFAWRVEQHCPKALRLLDSGDLQSLREARHALLRRRLALGLDPNDFRELFATSGSDLYQQMAPAELTRREIAAIHRSDLSLVVSDVEIDLLVNGFGVPPALLHWCPPMPEAPRTATVPFGEREHIIAFVDFRDPADWDSVLWLKHNIWPMVRRHLPDAQLHLHGPSPSAKALALHDPAGGLLIFEHDAEPAALLGKARLCLAALRFGAGIKGVLLDAMLAGTPSITTPIGSEAMHGTQPWPGQVSATAEGLAKAVIALYADEDRWNQAQRNAAPLLDTHFNRRWHGAALAERIEQTLMELADQRLYNFTGAMLRQQQRSLRDAGAADRCP